MKMAEARRVAAEPSVVSSAAIDLCVTVKCVPPGCESPTGSASSVFKAVAVQKALPLKARFGGKPFRPDTVKGRSLRISGKGPGHVTAGKNKEGWFGRIVD
jgi:carbon monoxide dehydrogenase subunit G